MQLVLLYDREREQKYTQLLGDSLYGSCYYGDGKAACDGTVAIGAWGIHPVELLEHMHTYTNLKEITGGVIQNEL